MKNLQGRLDEIESGKIAVAALTDALHRATVFDRASIKRALVDAEYSVTCLSLELLCEMEAA